MKPTDDAPFGEVKTLVNIKVPPSTQSAAQPGSGAEPAGGSRQKTPPKIPDQAQDSKTAKEPKDRKTPESKDPEAQPASGSLVLAGALLVGTVGAAGPLLLLAWMVLALLATSATAEALEQTGGLMPTTFGGGYWLALGVDAAILLWSLVRRFRGHPAAWRPLVILTLVYALLLWTLVPLDLYSSIDIPDVLTTFALIGAETLIEYVLPLALVALLGKVLLQAWRTRQSMAAIGCLGLAGLTVLAASAMTGSRGYFEVLGADLGVLWVPVTRGVERERESYASLAAELGAPAPKRYASATATEPALGCAEELANAREQERPLLEATSASLIREGLSRSEAEDLVLAALLQVCTAQPQNDTRDLASRFGGAVRSLRGGATATAESACALSALEALRAARSGLGPADQLVLELRYVQGSSPRELGARLGKREAAARQQAMRVLQRLQRVWTTTSLRDC